MHQLELRGWDPKQNQWQFFNLRGNKDLAALSKCPHLTRRTLFTGKEDRYNEKLFEGDVIRIAKQETAVIYWSQERAGFYTKIEYAAWGWDEAVVDHLDRIVKIATIWDDPTYADLVFNTEGAYLLQKK